VIERLPDGHFDQDACRLRYLSWLRDPERRSARSEADARFIDAKTELLRLRVAEKRRDLIPRHEVDETLDAIAGIVTTHLGGMAPAARLTSGLGPQSMPSCARSVPRWQSLRTSWPMNDASRRLMHRGTDQIFALDRWRRVALIHHFIGLGYEARHDA